MKLTGGEIVVRALEDEGITCTFGIPGTHNIELYDTLEDSRAVRPVLVTDEQSAGFMADGFWRASGRMACVNIVPGAGLTHALSGIAEAFMDGVPMLVLGCGIRRNAARAYQLHDVDQLAIAAPVTKATFRPATGTELYRVIREACGLARSGTPGPVMVEVSIDHYLTRHEVEPSEWGPGPDRDPPAAAEGDLTRAAGMLGADGVRPLLYVGLGARSAQAELVELAERLEAPVSTTIQGKGVFPESHPLFLWNGLGAPAPGFVRDIAAERTVTLAVGCRFSEVGTGSYGFTPPGTLIHVDINPEVLGRNFPAELAVSADAKAFLSALLQQPSLPHRHTAALPALHARIAAGHAETRRSRRERKSPDRVTPGALLDSLQSHFGPEAVFTADSGNGTFLAMECLRLEQPGRFLAPVDYSCMGYAVPAAIGAKLGRPEVPVVALAGDGAFLMTGLELLTAASGHLPIVVVLLRDGELAQIAQFQGVALSRKVCSRLPDYDAESLCRGLGVEHVRLDEDAEIGAALERAAAAQAEGRPVLVEAAVDYSQKTYFTRGVVKTNLLRLSWPDRLRFLGRALARKATG